MLYFWLVCLSALKGERGFSGVGFEVFQEMVVVVVAAFEGYFCQVVVGGGG